jgi:hypothetical protein
MPANNTFAGSLNAMFKENYADKIEDLIPDGVKVLNMIKFMPKDKQPGNLYHQPVILGLEHGVTFASSDEDAFNLNAPIAGVIKDAQVRGYPMVLRSVLGYTAASRAAQGGKQAFMDATKYLVSNMLRSVTKKLEIEMLYGQLGYATVASNVGPLLQITASEWAPGIWAGAEGMPVEIRSVSGAVSRGQYLVQTVSLANLTVTLNADPSPLTAGDVIWHKGAYGNEFPGIHFILQNTGTIFNINAGVYNLFAGNNYPAGGAALSFNKLNLAAARGVEKGQDGKLVAMVNPRAWSNMMNDQAALRRYDGSYSKEKAEMGSKSILFHSQNGEIEIQPSIYIKQGYAFLLNVEDWMRVGSQDVSFKRPGQGEEFFRDLENAAGYELRLYTDQAVFCMAPGRSTYISGIVNST